MELNYYEWELIDGASLQKEYWTQKNACRELSQELNTHVKPRSGQS